MSHIHQVWERSQNCATKVSMTLNLTLKLTSWQIRLTCSTPCKCGSEPFLFCQSKLIPTEDLTWQIENGSNPGREIMQKLRFLRYGLNMGQKTAKTNQITISRECLNFGNMLGSVWKQIYPNMVGKYWQIQKTSFLCSRVWQTATS